MTDKNFTPLEVRVAAKTLIQNGYSSRKVERILGIDHSTAILYSREETPEEMKEFSTIFDNYIKEHKNKGISMVYQRILELIPKERRIDQVVKAGEFLEGKKQETDVAIQVNNFIKNEKNEFGI